MVDKTRYQVFEAPAGISHLRPDVIGRKAAYETAMALGERIAIYRWRGLAKHWDLIVDRTVANHGNPFSKSEHIKRMLKD